MNSTASYTFVCEKCQFYSDRKNNYEKHLMSIKHKANYEPTIILCDKCNKQYKTRTGLWKHKKTCNANTCTDVNVRPEKLTLEIVIEELMRQNQEIKHLLMEQTEKIQELTNRPPHQVIQQISNGNNNIINNTTQFNLNVFLNETCKHAINLSEFIDNIRIEMSDVEEVGRLGYVDGISRIILNELNRLTVFRRPIHCTDAKRETIYVKNNDKWAKDVENQQVEKVVKTVAEKNIQLVPEWRHQHPEAGDGESPLHEKHLNIMIAAIGGIGGSSEQKTRQNMDKVIKQLVKSVHVKET